MKIRSCTLRNILGAGDTEIVTGPLTETNVIIGRNNSGKSNVIRAIKWLATDAAAANLSTVVEVPDAFIHQSEPSRITKPRIALELQPDPEEIEAFRAHLKTSGEMSGHPSDLLLEAVAKGVVWEFVGAGSGTKSGHMELHVCNEPYVLNEFFKGLIGGRTPEVAWRDTVVPILIKRFISPISRSISYASGWRTLKGAAFSIAAKAKRTIIQDLYEWSHADVGERHLLKHLTRVTNIFANLLDWPGLSIVVNKPTDSPIINYRGRYLSVDSLGDGVHHMLMLAHAVVTSPTGIILMEEPETHLHPEMQRRIMGLLKTEFHGQTIITTHSPTFLDTRFATAIFRMEHDNDVSLSSECVQAADLYRVLDVLDVRASDILQANVVVWVEGPTDRMFLNRCLELKASGLEEGRHYQIAYYGGSIRSHVTFDETIKDFVNLLKLGRHAIMVCDSDRESDGDSLGETKVRLQNECSAVNALYIVTDGREVENYLPDSVLSVVYQECLGDASITVSLGQWDRLGDTLNKQFAKVKHGQKQYVDYQDNKVDMMARFLQKLTAADLSRWGLDKRLDQIVKFINRGNEPLASTGKES